MHLRSGLNAPLLILLIVAGTAGAKKAPGPEDLVQRAEGGDPGAALALGMRYRDGRGVPRDDKAAVHWYRRCADLGSAEGLDNVGFMYLRGRGVPENWDVAAGYFKASAEMGHAQGLFNLGNCHFSGQGVGQSYERAIDAWQRAAASGHPRSIWRLAALHASGEGLPRDDARARTLCEPLARAGDLDSMLLLGELHWRSGDRKTARSWWDRAAKHRSTQARALLELWEWRHEDPVADRSSFVEVDHLYQGWNNCGATSIAMFARTTGCQTDPYAVKRLCPRSPIGTGTDWADLVAAGEKLGRAWELRTFSNDTDGFAKGVKLIRQHLDANRPVVIDFTVTRQRDGRTEHYGHTLLVVGYHAGRDQFVLKNPNQPPPGIELMSAEELQSNWYSRGYSRAAKGRAARPLIVAKD